MSKKVKARSLDVESAGRGVWLLKVRMQKSFISYNKTLFYLYRISSGHENIRCLDIPRFINLGYMHKLIP